MTDVKLIKPTVTHFPAPIYSPQLRELLREELNQKPIFAFSDDYRTRGSSPQSLSWFGKGLTSKSRKTNFFLDQKRFKKSDMEREQTSILWNALNFASNAIEPEFMPLLDAYNQTRVKNGYKEMTEVRIIFFPFGILVSSINPLSDLKKHIKKQQLLHPTKEALGLCTFLVMDDALSNHQILPALSFIGQFIEWLILAPFEKG